MGTVQRLAEEVKRGLDELHPQLRKTVRGKLALAVGAMIEGQTPNTVELANLLPLETERQDMREQWLRRLLKNPLRRCPAVMEPLARQELANAAWNGQTVLLSLDQTDLGDRMAVLMVSVRVGDRALPLAWLAAEGPANIGFTGQRTLLDRVRGWLPEGVAVMLLADRFYPSIELFEWLHVHGWHYRLRLKGNLLADPGYGEETTTGELARGVAERHLPNVRLFAKGGVVTHLGILHEAGHKEPWLIAMDCLPTRAAVLDDGARWAIEPTFSDFKGRGFELEDSQLEHADRLERLILIMAVAMHWCVRVGRDDALHHPTPLEKNSNASRPGPLELPKTLPERGFLVQTRPTPPDERLAKQPPFASFSCGHEKLIGGEVKIGCTAETLRRWVRQAERDNGERAGTTTSERERIKELEREVRELRQANEILRQASAYFA